ncbi:DUF2079 domain-containing protein [Ferroplasma sp.]|uniref:DUF2079 domain-containing protein n=1 Tax=Ferroplasma sp. TaxID=2591003 RepID=UPI002612966A|nr:DUF2079 domain-containing protein [Ferroplasma sp.]
MLSNLHERIPQYIRNHKKDFLAFSIAFAFFIVFSIFSILQYYSLGTSAYDLGINAQSLYVFIHKGTFYTPLLNENTLVQHFTIFKFTQVPIYYFFPSPISIMIYENLFIALGGYIVYLLSMKLLSDHIKSVKLLYLTSIGFLLSYEFSPFTESLVSFPFHMMAFLPFFLLLAFYSFLSERRVLHIISLVFIISIHANFIYLVAILLLYEFLFLHTSRGRKVGTWLSAKSKPTGVKNFSYFIVFIVLAYGYLVFAAYMKLRLAGIPSLSVLPTTGETGTPVSSPVTLVLLLFHNPGEFTSIIGTNSGQKIFYLNLLFKSNIYLPLFSPLSLMLLLPYSIYALPSSYSAYYQLGYMYTALVVGSIYISAIIGAYNLIRLGKFIYKHSKSIRLHTKKVYTKLRKSNAWIPVISLIIIVVLIISIPFGLLSPPAVQQTGHGTMSDIFEQNSNGAASFLINVSRNLPPDSYILTENSLMPYFSNDINTYSTPWSPGYYNILPEFRYIVIQNNSLWATQGGNHSLQIIVNNGITNGNYTIIGSYVPANIMILENTHNMTAYIKK